MILNPPIVALNFKAYPQVSTKEGCMRLSKIAEEVSKDYGVTVVISPPFPFLAKVCEEVEIPVFAQHVDPVQPGAKTGHVTLEQVKGSGASGFILNHSEHRMILADIDWIVKRAKSLGLISLVCTNTVEVSAAVAALNPDIIAIEPPELIGGDISVTSAKPEIVSGTVEAVKEINKEVIILTGAGVKRAEDLKKALELGTQGVLLASGYVKAKDPKKFLEDLISVLRGAGMPSDPLCLFYRKRREIKGVFLGFNSNIDSVVRLEENPELVSFLEKHFPEKVEEVDEVRDLGALSLALYLCIKEGSSAEYLITKEISEELSKRALKKEERIGGPVGIVGNVLSRLGINCIVHSPSLSPRQVMLFEKGIKIVSRRGIEEIREEEGDPDLIHWILEFKRGSRFKFGREAVTAPRENRLIASYDPLNSKLHIRREYLEKVREISSKVSHAIISGYHLLTPKVNFRERLRVFSNFLSEMMKEGVLVHIEMAYNPFFEIRMEILRAIRGKIDSMGINEVELSFLCKDLGIGDPEGIRSGNPEEIMEAMIEVCEKCNSDRIHLHTYGMYVECVRSGEKFRPTKEALELSSIFAAAKAKKGDIKSEEDLKGVSGRKLEEMKEIASRIDGEVRGEYEFVAIPSLIVEDPVATVGLGDIISSTAFLFR